MKRNLKDLTVGQLAQEAENLTKEVENLSQEKSRLEKELSRLQKDVLALDEKKENVEGYLQEREKDLLKDVAAKNRKADDTLESLNARNEASRKVSEDVIRNAKQSEKNLTESERTLGTAKLVQEKADNDARILKALARYITDEVAKVA
jgi:predicted nuclease with TOPRIM domain